MAVTYNPFVSKSGFKSEGFEVNPSGDLTAGNVSLKDIVAEDILATNIDASSIKINGVPIFGGGGDSTAPSVFQLETDFIVSEGSTPYLSIINGQITINNKFDSIGSIDNVEIGSTTPRAGTFTSITTGDLGIPLISSNTNLTLSAANAIVFRINGSDKGRIDENGITVPVTNTTISNVIINNAIIDNVSIDNATIGGITPGTGTFTSLTISNQPTSPSNATRKDYVDNQISAFAIAFGI